MTVDKYVIDLTKYLDFVDETTSEPSKDYSEFIRSFDPIEQ